jgi:uncharacterized membrane protein SpoIIM required for sporulation
MIEDAFVAERKAEWDELERLLSTGSPLDTQGQSAITRFSQLYRALSADLMRARAEGYSGDLQYLLDSLAARAHNTLYASAPYRTEDLVALLTQAFPSAVRRYWWAMAISAVLFFLPFLIAFIGSFNDRAFALSLLPADVARGMEEAYSKGFADGRDPGMKATMTGFYVYNNIGIAFRVFATGVFFGLGSVFFLIYNGLFTGAVAGLVTTAGYGRNIFTFMAGHSVFELGAIVISGGAGIVMGDALVKTHGLTRWASLRRRGRELVALISGCACMLAIAAVIEGFWSPSSLPDQVKWVSAAMFFIIVLSYLVLAGRRRA